jgi:hypothetical protein
MSAALAVESPGSLSHMVCQSGHLFLPFRHSWVHDERNRHGKLDRDKLDDRGNGRHAVTVEDEQHVVPRRGQLGISGRRHLESIRVAPGEV